MSLSRRYFLKAAAAVGATSLTTRYLHAEEAPQSSSPNEKLGVAVIGTGGQGGAHTGVWADRKDVEILYLCDADTSNAGAKIAGVEKKTGHAPQVVQDFHRVLDDPRVDVISTATPNHWHSLVSILALQAGKHVYVEKPVSHNVWEGRQLVGWSRATGKLCQCGTQSRSSQSLKDAVEFVQSGKLGKIQYAIGTCYKPRKSIGKLDQPLKLPETVDYDLWCGPAAKVDLYRPKFHYDWHWDFNTGNGDMGNQGIHQMDIARWFLGEQSISPRILSIGGRLGYEDAGNTPNTQTVLHAYEKAPLIFETRGLPQRDLDYNTKMDNYRGSRVGVIVQCEQGYVVIPSYTTAIAYDNDGNAIQEWKASGSALHRHFDNFVASIRAGDRNLQNGEILEGHLSSALCHTGAISHILGQKLPTKEIAKQIAGDALFADSYDRMAQHLAANGVDISDAKVTMGATLNMDTVTENFLNNPEADALHTREYRQGFEVAAAPDANKSIQETSLQR